MMRGRKADRQAINETLICIWNRVECENECWSLVNKGEPRTAAISNWPGTRAISVRSPLALFDLPVKIDFRRLQLPVLITRDYATYRTTTAWHTLITHSVG